LFCLILVFFEIAYSLCSLGWTWTLNPSALSSKVPKWWDYSMYYHLLHKKIVKNVFSFKDFFFFFQYWGLNSGPSPWATPPALFLWRVFQIGFCELFPQAGFKPQSSWSPPPE
jgi:hypothetical protein